MIHLLLPIDKLAFGGKKKSQLHMVVALEYFDNIHHLLQNTKEQQ
jgi:hypothetical protein